MLRSLLILLTFAWSIATFAQSFKPGTQASSSMTENKGSTNVDHATGILNYSLPLTSISQSGFEVPVSLFYSAKGIKSEQKETSVGRGFGLEAGGEIIRIVRGGKQDELSGFYHHFNPEDPTDQMQLNEGNIDGESDLFIASFKGRSVKFLVEENSLNKILAIPLEQSDIQIECVIGQDTLSGFKITDENGVLYSFLDPEYVEDLSAHQDVSTTDIYLPHYVSSWHMSEITIPNGDKFWFTYTKPAEPEVNSCTNSSLFFYGRPMKEPDRYNPEYSYYYEMYMGQLEELSILNHDNPSGLLIAQLGNQIQMATYNYPNVYRFQDSYVRDTALHRLVFCGVFMPEDPGIFTHTEELQSLLNMYTATQMESLDAFRNTKNNLVMALRNMYIYPKDVNSRFFQSNFTNRTSPLLVKSIQGKEGRITFNYTPGSSILKSIETWNQYGEGIGTVRLDYSSNSLKSVLFYGERNNSDSLRYTFNYYTVNNIVGQDYWGFYSTKSGSNHEIPNDNTIVEGLWNNTPDYFLSPEVMTSAFPGSVFTPADRNPDIAGTVNGTLKELVLPYGGKLSFTYELNDVQSSIGGSVTAGGLRIKEILQLDANAEVLSKVNYKYQIPTIQGYGNTSGRLVAKNGVGSWEYIQYPEFTDFALRSKLPEALGHFCEVGNNGVFYSYTEEIQEGKGRTGYQYLDFRDSNPADAAYYPHWLERLLTATYYYNQAGQLVKLERNKYAISTSDLGLSNSNSGDLLVSTGARPFNRELKQYKRNMYVLPPTTPSNYPNVTTNVGLPPEDPMYFPPNYQYYPINYSVAYNAYVDYFIPNLLPRMNPVEKYKVYSIFVGGKVLPVGSETITYGQPTALADLPAYSGMTLLEALANFSGSKPVIESTKLYYDNPLHCMATRIERADSRGRITTVKNKYPLDYSLPSGDPISVLAAQNILTYSLEEQHWLRENSSTVDKLVASSLTEYSSYAGPQGLPTVVLPVKKYVINEEAPVPVGTTLTQGTATLPPFSSLFHENHALYKLDQSIDWTLYGSSYQRTKVKAEHNALPVSYIWDEGRKIVLLEASAGPDEIAAFDKMNGLTDLFNSNNYPVYTYSDPQSWRFLQETGSLDYYSIAEQVVALLDRLKRIQPELYVNMKADPVFVQIEDMYNTVLTEKNGISLRVFLTPRLDSVQSSESSLVQLTSLSNNYMDFMKLYGCLRWIETMLISEDPSVFQTKFVTRNYRTKYLRNYVSTLAINAAPGVSKDGKFSVIASFLELPGAETGFHYIVGYSSGLSFSSDCAPNTLIKSGNILKAEIDLSGLPNKTNITSLTVSMNTTQEFSLVNMILCPSGVNFKASSYTTNNQLISEFGPDLHPSYYIYDGMGRVSSVKDQYGNIIKKSQYHFKPTAQSN